MPVMISNSIAAAAAQKRVNRPSMMHIPPRNSMNNAAQIHGSAGSKPDWTNASIKADGPRDTLPQPWTMRFQPHPKRMTNQDSGMTRSYNGFRNGSRSLGSASVSAMRIDPGE